MALTYTPGDELGAKMPEFDLTSVFGEKFSSHSMTKASVKVVVFICAHCPYVQSIESRLVELGRKIEKIGGQMVAICSNDPTEYPEDSKDQLAIRAKHHRYSFPYLVDETQEVARAFGAVCTPDFFVYDINGSLTYRGRLDDSWKDATKVKREELWMAAQKIAKGEKISPEQSPSMGCSIKWRH
jgi:peroxiredoxin